MERKRSRRRTPRKEVTTTEPTVEPTVEKSPSKGGWGRFLNKKEEIADREANKKPREFWLKDGETAVIQVLESEPYVAEFHSVRNAQGKFTLEPCQLENQKHCVLCQKGMSTSTRGVFKVLDFRGSWNKDTSDFNWDEPTEKVWLVGLSILEQLYALTQKRGQGIDKFTIEVTRSGTGTNTRYNFSRALNDSDEPWATVTHSSDFASAKDMYAPIGDDAMLRKGYESYD